MSEEITNATAIRRSIAKLLLPGAETDPAGPACKGMMYRGDALREAENLVDSFTAGLATLPEKVREVAGDEAAAVAERHVESVIADLRRRLEQIEY